MGAVLNTVYYTYLATYSPRQLTKYDTHKKSELRSVYNSIVKLNKDAPWYLPTTSKDTQHYAVSLKENARELHNAIAQLGGLEQDGMFRKKSAYSTDTEVAEAAYIGSDALTGTSPEFDLEVKELATPQENLGYFLPDLATTLVPDTYSFDIAINDMNYEFQFNINTGDTNRQIMERLTRLINNADIGITAEVAESDSRYALRLTSDTTGIPAGKPYHFRVSDVKNHYIKFNKRHKRLLEQMEHFPMGAHDDGVDALEGCRTIAKKMKRFRVLDKGKLGL